MSCKLFRNSHFSGRLHLLMFSVVETYNLENFWLPLGHIGNIPSSLPAMQLSPSALPTIQENVPSLKIIFCQSHLPRLQPPLSHLSTWVPRQTGYIEEKQFPLCKCSETKHWGTPSMLSKLLLNGKRAPFCLKKVAMFSHSWQLNGSVDVLIPGS